jgi:hypothetical protein
MKKIEIFKDIIKIKKVMNFLVIFYLFHNFIFSKTYFLSNLLIYNLVFSYKLVILYDE